MNSTCVSVHSIDGILPCVTIYGTATHAPEDAASFVSAIGEPVTFRLMNLLYSLWFVFFVSKAYFIQDWLAR